MHIGMLLILMFMVVIFALFIFLQVWLCKKSLRLGLILPTVAIILAVFQTLLFVFNLVGADWGNWLVIGLIFLVSNIPAIVFGGIWLHYKGRQDTVEDLKRMKIEDLE